MYTCTYTYTCTTQCCAPIKACTVIYTSHIYIHYKLYMYIHTCTLYTGTKLDVLPWLVGDSTELFQCLSVNQKLLDYYIHVHIH